MRRDVRFAAAARDDGIRKVGKITWGAGLAGVIGSGLLALAFGMHAAAQPAGSGTGGGSGSGSGSGSISVPAQPPGPGQGAGQVNSGGS
jgi:hypothetical protein